MRRRDIMVGETYSLKRGTLSRQSRVVPKGSIVQVVSKLAHSRILSVAEPSRSLADGLVLAEVGDVITTAPGNFLPHSDGARQMWGKALLAERKSLEKQLKKVNAWLDMLMRG